MNRHMIGKQARNSGVDFEEWLEKHHSEALRLGIVSGPIEHNEPHARMIHGKWQLVEPGVADFGGVLYNGHGSTLAVEAKKRNKRLYRNEITVKQQQHLDAVVRGGGLALLLVRIVDTNDTIEAACPWQSVPWTVAKSAEGVTSKDLQPWRIPAERTCYLEPYCSVRGAPATAVVGRRIFPRE